MKNKDTWERQWCPQYGPTLLGLIILMQEGTAVLV